MNRRERIRKHGRGETRRQETARATRFEVVEHMMEPYAVLDEEGLERIHQTSLRILSRCGIDFYDEEILKILRTHGAVVEGSTARFDPELVMEYVAKAPAHFRQLARNEENSVPIGGRTTVFSPVYGPPYVLDLDKGRRDATLEDFVNFIKLAYSCPYMHHSGGTVVEPTDLPVETRHLDMIFSHIKYSDKAFMGSVISVQGASDTVKMAEILLGAEAIRENPAVISLINVSSPRRFDDRMLGALKVYAEARQAVIVTPFILSGAMAPVTISGTVAQQNAEALAGIALCQMIQAGTPVVYGSFLTNIDLQSGAPVFGSPESQLGLFASAQLARRYGLPFRGGGAFSSSKTPDAQAGYESVMTLSATVLAQTNFVLHAAGWLENGLVAGYEKFVLDCELLGMMHVWAKGLDLSEDALAFETISTVPPGGHHLGTEHTMQRFRTAFFRSEIFDYNSAEKWAEEGSKSAYERANEKVKAQLDSYEAPPLDPAVEEELEEFVARRKAEIQS